MSVDLVHVVADLSRIFCAVLVIVALFAPGALFGPLIRVLAREIVTARENSDADQPETEVKPPEK